MSLINNTSKLQELKEKIEEIEDVIGIEAEDAPLISAKNGINIQDVLLVSFQLL